MILNVEHPFTLPYGYIDGDGNLHKDGVMRLATAADEIEPFKEFRVRDNPAYLTIAILSRVIVRLGSLKKIDCETVEKFFSKDLAFLNDLYERLNNLGSTAIPVVCPYCGEKHEVEVNFTREG